MLTADHLLNVVDAFREARGISDSRVSTLLFNDGKRIKLLRAGGDLGSRHLAAAMRWLSENWPTDAVWPADITRPDPMPSAANTAAAQSEVAA
ncbi:hypothetical protein MOX02_44880 [Methylobacterium oxalidis]|uniref:Uncharacterized protein n=1 Tax=Methylobacterium oxalidis TaxID=944322 RepID=A0A512J907_9HYPH|nr:hypothetical protein MOX02_44880 [Methylobacterium oxalidis]GLS65490.1 hypothetical protein GCM10007888_38720 [Methylobacterium oxalidis]